MDIIKTIYDTGDVTFLVFVINIFLGLVLSLIVCYMYRLTFRGITYSQTFLLSLVLMTMVTSVLISVIGGNLARAFALVGALSIIRYRTAIKDARDTGFIFLCVATGMIIGAGYYLIAIGLVVFVSLVLIILHKVNFACDSIHRNVIKINFLEGNDSDTYENNIRKILDSAYKQTSLIEHFVDSAKKRVHLTFVATSLDSGKINKKQRKRERRVIQEIQQLSSVENVSIVTDQLQQNI
ncbi:MAG: DUF4956 domain-containing protein [Candidatus Omnitrophica bacterium]|nr:DUF4956 domain-containing protein [Candidatus Omnitrophota bacterium]